MCNISVFMILMLREYVNMNPESMYMYIYIYTIINIYIYMVQICSNVDVYDLDVCPRLRTILTYIPSSRTITYTVKCRTSV